MKKKAIIVSGIIFLAALVSGLADEPVAKSSDDMGRMMQKGAKGLGAELGLSAEKKAELREQMHQMRKRMIELKAEREIAQADLEHLLEADSIDENAVLQAVDKVAQVTGDILKARVKTRLEINKMLTPEQRARMKELRQQMKQRHGERLAESREQRSKRGIRRDMSGGETPLNQEQETGIAQDEPADSF